MKKKVGGSKTYFCVWNKERGKICIVAVIVASKRNIGNVNHQQMKMAVSEVSRWDAEWAGRDGTKSFPSSITFILFWPLNFINI